MPGGEERPGWYQPSWFPNSFRTEDLEPYTPTASLESGGLKGMGAGAPAGLLPARLPVDVLLSGLSLTGWLAGWLTG